MKHCVKNMGIWKYVQILLNSNFSHLFNVNHFITNMQVFGVKLESIFFFVTYRNSKWQDPYFCFSTLWDKCISCACWLNIFYWSRPSYVYVYNHLFIQTKVVSLKQTLLQPMVPQNFTVWFLFFLCGFWKRRRPLFTQNSMTSVLFILHHKVLNIFYILTSIHEHKWTDLGTRFMQQFKFFLLHFFLSALS